MRKEKQANYIGEKIKQFRKSLGWTQTELGKRIDLSKRMISYYESQTEFIPNTEILQKISNAFGITINEILNTNKNPSEKKKNELWLYKKLKKAENLSPKSQRKIIDYIETLQKLETVTKSE